MDRDDPYFISPVLRDAMLRMAPQDEVGVRGEFSRSPVCEASGLG